VLVLRRRHRSRRCGRAYRPVRRGSVDARARPRLRDGDARRGRARCRHRPAIRDPGGLGRDRTLPGGVRRAGDRRCCPGPGGAVAFRHLGETRYRAPSPPRGMTRAAAALLERTLPLATQEAAVRKANAEALLARIPPDSRARAVAPPRPGTPGFLRLPLRLPNGLAGLPDPRLPLRLGVTPGYPTTLAALPPVRERLTRATGRWPG